MCFANGRCLLCIAFLVLFAALLILAVVHRVRAKKKVLALTPGERVRLLNELAEPFGFAYLPSEDIFTSRLDAWQRDNGYEAKYDTMAVGAGMVIDAFPVYFNYEGRTWLVEFWKGQYGINTGGEVGIYHAKGVIPPHAYHTAHFEAVSDAELPRICSCLDTAEETFYEICARHWWLTGVRMNFSEEHGLIPGIYRSAVLLWNRLLCRGFRIVTYPWKRTADRMVFLYYLLPGWFRKILVLSGGRCKPRCRTRKPHRSCRGR